MTTQNSGILLRAIMILSLMLSFAGLTWARNSLSSKTSGTTLSLFDGEVYTIKEAGLQFDVPQGWKVQVDKENNTVLLSVDDGAVTVTFLPEDKFEDVVAGMKSSLKEKVPDLKSDGEPKQDTHNGMIHISESGTGSLTKIPVIWSIDVLKATRTVTILTFGIKKNMEEHIDDYLKIVNSLKKV
jgi:hypothetical protein